MKFHLQAKFYIMISTVSLLLILGITDLSAQKTKLEFGGGWNFSFYQNETEAFQADFPEIASPKAMIGSSGFAKLELQLINWFSIASGLELAILGARDNVVSEKEWGTYLTVPIELRFKMDDKTKLVGGVSYQYAWSYYYLGEESQLLLDTRNYWNLKFGYHRALKERLGIQISFNHAFNKLYTVTITDQNGVALGDRTFANRYIQFSVFYILPLGKKGPKA